MLFYIILPAWLAKLALWCRISQRGFTPKEDAIQKAARFPSDCCLVVLWCGLRLVTCARDAGKMVFFTPS